MYLLALSVFSFKLNYEETSTCFCVAGAADPRGERTGPRGQPDGARRARPPRHLALCRGAGGELVTATQTHLAAAIVTTDCPRSRHTLARPQLVPAWGKQSPRLPVTEVRPGHLEFAVLQQDQVNNRASSIL